MRLPKASALEEVAAEEVAEVAVEEEKAAVFLHRTASALSACSGATSAISTARQPAPPQPRSPPRASSARKLTATGSWASTRPPAALGRERWRDGRTAPRAPWRRRC
jgi:hypothetical protein